MDNLQKQIGNLRTLQESYDLIAAAAEAYNVGKTDLASAITAKGVETAATDSLATMADNVREIVQETTTISGGEFYPQNMLGSSVWNLFGVAAMVKSQYISSGRYAGAIVAQYYKGYATLDLTLYGGGYAACLTSDGDFYANDGEHTPIGIHTWHDDDSGKADRYVVFLWLDDDYTFQTLSSGVCPRQIVVLGTCASIQVNYNRLVQLYAPTEFGELKNFRLAGSNTPEGNWAAVQVWQNYKEHATGTMFQNVNSMIYAEFTNLERLSGGNIFYNGTYQNLSNISFPNLVECSGYIINNASNTNDICASLVGIYMPKLQTINGSILFNINSGLASINSLTEIFLPELEIIHNAQLIACTSYDTNRQSLTKLKSVRLPALKSCNGSIFSDPLHGNSGVTYCMNAVELIDLSSLRYVTGGRTLMVRQTAMNAVTEIKIQSLEEVTGNGIFMSIGSDLNSKDGFNALEHISFDALRICSGQGLIRSSFGNGANTSLKKLARIELPAIEIATNATLYGTFPALEYIYVGFTDNDRTLTVNLSGATAPLLTDIELKDGYCKNLTCSSYTALTAENIVAHMLNRLGVNQAYLDEPTNANKLTITLGATNLAKLTDEEKQIAIDKGFTLA